MGYPKIDKKTWEKWLKEDIELHKRVITSYLWEQGLNGAQRSKFFVIYDHYISIKNIRDYCNLPSWVFVRALLLDELWKVKSWIQTKPTPEEREYIDQKWKEHKKRVRKEKREARRAERNKKKRK